MNCTVKFHYKHGNGYYEAPEVTEEGVKNIKKIFLKKYDMQEDCIITFNQNDTGKVNAQIDLREICSITYHY